MVDLSPEGFKRAVLAWLKAHADILIATGAAVLVTQAFAPWARWLVQGLTTVAIALWQRYTRKEE